MRSRSGSSIVLALIAILIVGGLAAGTWSRVTQAQSQQNQTKMRVRSTVSLDAALELAINKIQRVGSHDSDETSASLLDTSTPLNLNGVNAGDGTFSWVVRSPTTSSKQRIVTATGTFNGVTRSRSTTYAIVPRIYRYALYVDGGGSSPAISLGASTSLLAPPAYKSAQDARGGDIGANNDINVANGAQVNYRPGATSLYDQYFLPSGATATNSSSGYYGGLPWGKFTRVVRDSGPSTDISVGGTPSTSFPTGSVNMDGSPTSLADTTDFPTFSGALLANWRSVAAANARSNPSGGNGALYTASQFQTALNGGSKVAFNGLVFVDCRGTASGTTLSLASGSTVTVSDGGIIIEGCNLSIPSDATLVVSHPVHDASNPSDCATSTPSPACAHTWPGLMVLADGAGAGGDFTSAASGSNYASVDGLTFVEHNMAVSATAAGTSRGTFNANGAVAVGGQFAASGSANLILRWNPLVQRTDFDPANGAMGTYTIKTNDRPPPGIPTVTIDGGPSDPTTSTSASFTWTSTGDVDIFQCRIDGGSWTTCTSPQNYSGLGGNQVRHVFDVQACNVSGCGSASYPWTINPPAPTVSITSGPAEGSTVPYTETSESFSWTTTSVVGSTTCDMDGTSTSCTSPQSYSGLPTGQDHTFTVTVCNVTDCASAQRHWTIKPDPPTVTFTSTPSNPSSSATVSYNFTWTLGGGAATSVTCQLDAGSATACSNSMSVSFANCANHTFKVTATNITRSTTATYNWHANCPAPTVSLTSRPGDYFYASGTITWSGSNIASCQIYRSWTGWSACTASGSNTSWSECCKPYGSHTIIIQVANADGSATASTSFTWDRENTYVPNGYFDDGSRWSYWAGCSNGDGRVYAAEDISGGGAHSPPSGVSLRTVLLNNGWGCVYNTAAIYDRADDVRFAAIPDYFGIILGYGYAQYYVWNGSSWVIPGNQEYIDEGRFHTDFNWRWLRFRGDIYPGYYRELVFYGRSRNNNCNQGGGGCGFRFDTAHGTGDQGYTTGVTNF